ncbi:MAG: winged helix-turn-helix transcriptional regulator [Sphaerochaetaceae bacterium]|jgi:DNA-binding MarR family transcriptional regulator|nr:winged helix-turn-helix transcriptional regulator [Sphaerochaetaceae bacterium]NLO69660.1 winged helix-turn-helix transcriptional regulator [Porphyromonadaceae bacterium]
MNTNIYKTMMQESNPKELEVLNYLNLNSDATQRDLSEHVGMSLGAINLLLKKLVKKGLIKIEKLQPNSVRYFLTPAGIADKIERTYRYIVRTYKELEFMRNKIISALNVIVNDQNKSDLIFYGIKDDFYVLISEILVSNYKINDKQIFSDEVSLKKAIKTIKNPLVITWDANVEKILHAMNVEEINLLRKIAMV